ncbi:MAG: chromosome segregation protein SMC [Tissierellia bacterium]|nr:chromosome segregation protein SMC [Tissierellia bacterium]
MRLKRLEIHGFKSFAERTILTFDRQFTVIVGPNGSGKSNISDAIRWVLGEQSAKSLRGTKMEDVIFTGTDTRKPLNFSKVNIVFDNEDGRLPIEYKEVAISRKSYRTGESEYTINKHNCRLRDIRELFMDTGIGKEGYSIISQGRIDEILSSKPEDRRAILDEATGTAKYKFKKDEAEKKLSKTMENLIRIRDIVLQLEDRTAFLKQESEKARLGLEKITLLERHQLYQYKKALEDSAGERLAIQEKLESLQIELAALEEEHGQIQDRLTPLKGLIDELTEESEELHRNLSEKERKRTQLEANRQILTEKITSAMENLTKSQDRMQSLQEENEGALIGLQGHRDRISEAQGEIQQHRGRVREINDQLSQTQQSIDQIKEDQRQGEEQLEILQAELTELRLSKNTAGTLMDTLQQDIDGLKASISKTQQDLEELKPELDSLEVEKTQANQQLISLLQQLETENGELDQAQDQLRSTEQLRQEKASRLKEMEYKRQIQQNIYDSNEGFNKAVQNFLKERKRNPEVAKRTMGTLADLITVDPLYQKAVEATLGGALQNIVTLDYNETSYLVKLVKERRMGRVTFLPKDRIFPRNAGKVSIPKSEYLLRGSEAVHCPEEIRGIVDYFLNQTLIVEDIDQAVALSKRVRQYRLVTLDGEIINTWGSVVAGSSANYSSQLINRRAAIEAMTEEIAQAGSQLTALEEDILIQTNRIAQRQKIQNDRKEQEGKLRVLLQSLDHSYAERQYEYKLLLNRKEQLSQDLMKKDEEKGSYSERNYGDMGGLEKQIEALNAALTQQDREKRRLYDLHMEQDKDILYWRNQVELAERDLAMAENRCAELEESLASKASEFQREKTASLGYETSIEAFRGDLDTEALELEGIDLMLKEGSIERDTLRTKITKMRTEHEELLERRVALAEEAAILRSSVEKLESNKELFESKLLSRLEDLREEYGYEDETLEQKLAQVEPIKTSRTIVLTLRQEIREIGHFSFDSIEEYKVVSEQLELYQTQEEDLIRSKEDIQRIIKKLNDDIVRDFDQSFHQINQRFNKIFSILFEGGKARLVIDGEDLLSAGVDIVVEPPGKKLQSLSLLSGGERALTAVALLFAIFESRPAPFCILDEVDAALDEANIGRYVKYLRSFIGIQFIIITHRKPTMELADVLYGVTMEEEGVSKMLSLALDTEG